MNLAQRTKRLKEILVQIAPQSDLKRLAEPFQSSSANEGERLEAAVDDDDRDEVLDVGRSDDESFALEALDVLTRNQNTTLDEHQLEELEAIVLTRYRPVLYIVKNSYKVPPSPWQRLGTNQQIRKRIESTIQSIGRIDVPNDPRGRPYAGTGFVVGDGLIMTNRHVADIFAYGLGIRNLEFKPGQTVQIDFKQEHGSTETLFLGIKRVLMVHPFWDMALLKVEGLSNAQCALNISVADPETLADRDVVVIGYPAQDTRNDLNLQNRIFGGVYDVKRFQPGKLKERRKIDSFGRTVNAVTHDSSTLGGNSGSAVIDVETGEVVGLHFGGRYLEANFAVPTIELARDSRVVDSGINFQGNVQPGDIYGSFWKQVEAGESSE